MKSRLIWFAGGLAAVLIAQEAADVWNERFANWTATRNLDAPAHNAIHLRHQATVAAGRAYQANMYMVPANRRLALEQMSVYCGYPNIPAGRLEQAHVTSLVNNTPARYPLVRNYNNAVADVLAGPLNQYADPGTPIQVTLGFTDFANAVCEVSIAGHTVQLAP